MKSSLKFSIAIFAFFLSHAVGAQEKLTEHILTAKAENQATPYKISDLSWMTGRWVGEGFGGQLEENWNPSVGNAMLGTFRAMENGKAKFYELCLIVEEDNTLIYKVKHFNPDFSGWEEKGDFASFRLLKLEHNAAYFDGLTIMRKGDTVVQYLAMKQRDGKLKEEVLTFRQDGNGSSGQVD